MNSVDSASQSLHVPAKTEPVLEFLIDAMERRLLPDGAIRFGIRRLCAQRIRDAVALAPEQVQENEQRYFDLLVNSPLAVHTQDANLQHYELPPAFFNLVLGAQKKYSCAFYPTMNESLDEAETAALDITMDRAELRDGMTILELGCGWGSLTLAMANRFPNAKIYALSNSAPQRDFIESQASERGLKNVKILTRDINDVETIGAEFGPFDRVISVEMFEHLRNYQTLFARISSWLKPEGKLFTHIFTHKDTSYLFETEGTNNWMGKYFFTGGQMPSRYLFRSFQKNLALEKQWSWNGKHYARTSDQWLANLDRNHAAVFKIMRGVYGDAEAARWLQRWRVFFLSCSELFGYDNGSEWFVSHYLFTNKRA